MIGTHQRRSLASRRAEFKSPPITRESSQDERRARALQEQKRQRTFRVNAARNIDLLSSLSLDPENLREDDEEEGFEIIHQGVGGYASMLAPGSSSVDSLSITENETQPDEKSSAEPYKQKRKPSKKKKSGSSSAIVHTASPTTLVQRARKRSRRLRYANICMFAELLELRDDDITTWSGDDMSMDAYSSLSATASDQRRTLPPDLETGWVALAPIPVGKRCLAVSQQSAVNGTSVVTSTHLHSRLKGMTLLKFPSPLPPDSILDCILDEAWQDNGIIHVLDIIRWRGTDFAECEAEFRFWWRDARLAEITPLRPTRSQESKPTSDGHQSPLPRAVFDFPFLFISVPHYTPPIPLTTYLRNVIPAARVIREIPVTFLVDSTFTTSDATMDMDENEHPDRSGRTISMRETGVVDPLTDLTTSWGTGMEASIEPQITTITARIPSDGLLLYVSEASYQPGETPLSCWVPASSLNQSIGPSMLDHFERLIIQQLEAGS